MVTRAAGIDVVLRVHDPARLDELGRAVFSAALQDYRPARLIVVCQRFGEAGVRAVRDALGPILAIVPEVGLEVLDEAGPGDLRARLLNRGLAAGRARYCAVLDYDDVIYPEAYRVLVAELEWGDAAIAFGGILNAEIACGGAVPYTRAKRHVFQGEGLARLLWNNFCPIHGFVLDRERIEPADLVVDEGLGALEDYDLLLRLCARYGSSFRLKDKVIGEYLLKDDGSNINPMANPDSQLRWDQALAQIEARKAALVLSPPVQAALGVDVPGLTVGAYLAGRGGFT